MAKKFIPALVVMDGINVRVIASYNIDILKDKMRGYYRDFGNNVAAGEFMTIIDMAEVWQDLEGATAYYNDMVGDDGGLEDTKLDITDVEYFD